MDQVLGLDLGTSYIKCMLVDKQGRCSPAGRKATPKHTEGTVCSMNPADFREAVSSSIEETVKAAGCTEQDICAISYASQTNTFLLLDDNLEPVSDIYIWSTEFSNDMDPALTQLFSSEEFLQITGNGYSSSALMAAKLKWLKDHRPELFDKASYVANLPDYLILSLTGNLISDASSASLLGLLDIRKLCWWNQVLDVLGMDHSAFPQVQAPGTSCGHTSRNNPFGLKAGIPVITGGLDHLVAAYGAGIGYLAPYSESTGTVLALMGLKDKFRADKRTAVGPALGLQYSYLSFYGYAAVAFEEFHDLCCPELTYDQMFMSAENVPVGSNGLVFNDLPGTGDKFICRFNRPVENTGEGVRAIMESLAFRLKKLTEHVAGREPVHSMVATGGGNRSRLLLKVKADMLACEMVLCSQTEYGAFGAAMVAACGIGWFGEIREAQHTWIKESDRIKPDSTAFHTYQPWLEKHEGRDL